MSSRRPSIHRAQLSRQPGLVPATVISDDVSAQLAKLKEQPGKDIALLGSCKLAASLPGTGLIDELRIMVNPVALGSSHPVLAGAYQTKLELVRVRQFASGNVLLSGRPGQWPVMGAELLVQLAH